MPYNSSEKKRKYQREWRKNKYRTDPDFRKREQDKATLRFREKNKCPEFRKKKAAQMVLLKENYIKLVQDLLDAFYENGCSSCDEKDRICLCAHHVNPKLKKFPIGSIKALRPKRERLIKELAKCISLCANCHMKLHAKLYAKLKEQRLEMENVRAEL